jgi:ribose transport system permease protein
MWNRVLLRELGPLLALITVFLLFAAAEAVVKGSQGQSENAVFLTSRNVRTIAVNTGSIAICALGMTLVIISGGIDLSVGTGLALCATVLAGSLKLNVPAPVAILLTLGTGALLGTINGALVSLLRVVPFIVTLGTMTIYLGAAKIFAEWVEQGGHTVRPDVATQVPEWLPQLLSVRQSAVWPGWQTGNTLVDGSLDWVRFPMGIWLLLLLSAGLAAMLRYTVFGRYLFALGSNEATARLCGIPVTRYRILVYALGGVFVGLAGIYQFSRLSSGNPTAGLGLELRVIAAVVIGGGSLSGGRG